MVQLEQNLGPGTVTTTYTYDDANQLSTADVENTTWHYTYDANGSLTEVLPNGNEANGAKRYTYNAAGDLVQVDEHDGTGWNTQAQMNYNGLNQRLSMDAAGVIAHYVMDGDQPLTAQTNSDTTYYLYGLGAIAEKTTAWSYSLPDGTKTPRQLTDLSADITLSARYTPWGDTLELHGTGSFTYGYFGGVLDAATGLLYVGNGQYYDPSTGRFLTRDAKPNNSNPYVPWDPTGAILAPLGIVALFFGKKKNGSNLGTFLVLLIVVGSVGVTLTGCDFTAQQLGLTPTSAPIPVTATATQSNGVITAVVSTPTQVVTVTAPAPTETPKLPASCGKFLVQDQVDVDNFHLLVKRIYNEGPSSFSDKTNRANVFMAIAWALRTLKFVPGSIYYGWSYKEITEAAFSFKNTEDEPIQDNDYEMMTQCILSTPPCAFGSNPWGARLIQWFSPQGLNRRDVNRHPILIHTDKIGGCNTAQGCQLPDMRSRAWLLNVPHVASVESFKSLGVLPETGFKECYWKGLYFYDSYKAHDTAAAGYFPDSPPKPDDQSSLLCPIGSEQNDKPLEIVSGIPIMPVTPGLRW